MALNNSHGKNKCLAVFLVLAVFFSFAELVKPHELKAASQESCAACHADFWQMPLSNLRQDAGPFSGDANQCPGLKAAWMEMAQIESWILAISLSLEQMSDWHSAGKIKQELLQVADLYRLAQTKSASSVSEIRDAFGKVQKQLNSRVFRPIVAQDKKSSLLKILGWVFLGALLLGGAYFLACRLHFSRRI
jgi:hypothetical protein